MLSYILNSEFVAPIRLAFERTRERRLSEIRHASRNNFLISPNKEGETLKRLKVEDMVCVKRLYIFF